MNSLKRKDNLFKFERDYENLIELSFKRREEGDYVGALSIMRSLMRTDDNPDVFAHIADIYADMDLYENAVNYWYKFLRYSKKKYYVDAYNGLGANFFLAGNDAVAGYYFNKQLEVGGGEDCVYEDVLEDYFNSLTEAKNSSYKVVYPLPKEKVEEEIYLSGKSFFDSEEYEKAVEKFESVEKGSGFYFKAKDEEAYALFYLNRIEEAYSLIKSLIKEGRKSISILSIAINAAAIIGTEKELGKFIDMLIGYDPDEDEEKYKKLNLLITLNLTDE
ncbi:MAG: hypothetical protein J5836_02830, partial [Clostridia bacterium]|nr:hypothetical protein [Clostridia bacterium]